MNAVSLIDPKDAPPQMYAKPSFAAESLFNMPNLLMDRKNSINQHIQSFGGAPPVVKNIPSATIGRKRGRPPGSKNKIKP